MQEREGPVRYYLGVDWADQTHAVWVGDERGTKITARPVPHTAEGLSGWGRELDEWRAQGLELWAAIERPEGRVVDFLLDHGVVVYPVNPKALDRSRDRFRQSAAKSDPFDARVLADLLRTDHPHLRALQPSSDAAQELKLLTEDCQRQIRQQTRLVNQLTATLKAEHFRRSIYRPAARRRGRRGTVRRRPRRWAKNPLDETADGRGVRPMGIEWWVATPGWRAGRSARASRVVWRGEGGHRGTPTWPASVASAGRRTSGTGQGPDRRREAVGRGAR